MESVPGSRFSQSFLLPFSAPNLFLLNVGRDVFVFFPFFGFSFSIRLFSPYRIRCLPPMEVFTPPPLFEPSLCPQPRQALTVMMSSILFFFGSLLYFPTGTRQDLALLILLVLGTFSFFKSFHCHHPREKIVFLISGLEGGFFFPPPSFSLFETLFCPKLKPERSSLQSTPV